MQSKKEERGNNATLSVTLIAPLLLPPPLNQRLENHRSQGGLCVPCGANFQWVSRSANQMEPSASDFHAQFML